MLGPSDLEDAAAAVAEIDPTAALVGGYALQLYGSSRLTGDLDVIAGREPDIHVIRRLTFGGIKTKLEGVPVDFIVRTDDVQALYEEALTLAQRLPGVPLKVVRLEYLLAMKMYAGRKKDEADIETILRMSMIDRRVALGVVKRHLGVMAAKDLQQVIALVDWQMSQPEFEDED